jgi:hypothetical protein
LWDKIRIFKFVRRPSSMGKEEIKFWEKLISSSWVQAQMEISKSRSLLPGVNEGG